MNINNFKDKFTKSIGLVKDQINNINKSKARLQNKIFNNENDIPLDDIPVYEEEQSEEPKFDYIEDKEKKEAISEIIEYEYDETDTYQENNENILDRENTVNELLHGIKDISKQSIEEKAKKKMQDKYID